MKIRFWGARGSFATPGHQFLRYGGNTTAIEIASKAGEQILIDLGTGATEFAKELMKNEFGSGEGRLSILLTHTHLDHIQGLPFFTPFFIKGNSIEIYGPETKGKTIAEVLQNQLNGYYSPLYGLENLAAGVSVKTFVPGTSIDIGSVHVSAIALPHGGTSVLGFRITCDDVSVSVMTDVEHGALGPSRDVLRFIHQSDVLIHDAMFSDHEYKTRRGWGHSSMSSAIDVAELSQAKQVVFTHHSPDSSDREIDSLVAIAAARTNIPVLAAREGLTIEL